jgi:hypothetical protein
MKIAPVFEEQFHRKQDSQQQLHLSPPLPKQLALEDISPDWASRLREKNKTTILSLTWMRWRFALQVASKCVVGEAYGYSSQYMDNCDECESFGSKFLYYFTFNWHEKLESNKQDFVKHWNEHHSNIHK